MFTYFEMKSSNRGGNGVTKLLLIGSGMNES